MRMRSHEYDKFADSYVMQLRDLGLCVFYEGTQVADVPLLLCEFGFLLLAQFQYGRLR